MGRSVLIVDDHPGFRRWAQVLLNAEGFDVVGVAADGTTAVREIARLDPDVVVLDIHLPDIDGFEVTRQIRVGERPAIVLISSRDPEEFGDRVRASGARGFVTKAQFSGAALEAIIGDAA